MVSTLDRSILLVFGNYKVLHGGRTGTRDGFFALEKKFMDRFSRKNQDPVLRKKNRIAIDPDWFLIAIMIAIAVLKSGSDCEMKIADRF